MENFNAYLSQPKKLGRSEAENLESLIEKFPYFQALRLMLAKCHKNQNTFGFNKYLKLASLYAGDRRVLYTYIQNDSLVEEEMETGSEPNPKALEDAMLENRVLTAATDENSEVSSPMNGEEPQVEAMESIPILFDESMASQKVVFEVVVKDKPEVTRAAETIKENAEEKDVMPEEKVSVPDALELMDVREDLQNRSNQGEGILEESLPVENHEVTTESVQKNLDPPSVKEVTSESTEAIYQEEALTNDSEPSLPNLELLPENELAPSESQEIRDFHRGAEVEETTAGADEPMEINGVHSELLLEELGENTPNALESEEDDKPNAIKESDLLQVKAQTGELEESELQKSSQSEQDFYSWLDNFALESEPEPLFNEQILEMVEEVKLSEDPFTEAISKVEGENQSMHGEGPLNFDSIEDDDEEFDLAAMAEIAYDIQAFVKHPEPEIEELDFSPKRISKPEIDALLDKFIQKNPSITRPKAEFYKPENMARKSEEFHTDVVSETLAKLLYKQGHLHKALEAYEKLMLQMPDKKENFAAQIKIIKEELINQL